MKTIVVIGAGQIGSRHIQALAGCAFPVSLQIVDPSEGALKTAKQRFCQIERSASVKQIEYFLSMESLTREIDLCIIATGADVRMSILHALLQQANVKNILFEKVLFQSTEDFLVAGKILEDRDIAAWVNCPRRAYSIYQDLKEILSTGSEISYRLSGGEWGLGCNTIHFLDLVAFLTGSSVSSVDNSGLDKIIRKCKRPGFIEFSGCFRALYANGTRLELVSIFGSNNPIEQSIVTGTHEIVISEYKNVMEITHKQSGENESITFDVPPVSRLTNVIAENIITNRDCILPTFAESSELHMPMIDALLSHMNRVTGTNSKLLPIT